MTGHNPLNSHACGAGRPAGQSDQGCPGPHPVTGRHPEEGLAFQASPQDGRLADHQGADKWQAARFLGMSTDVLERTYGKHHPDFMNEATGRASDAQA